MNRDTVPGPVPMPNPKPTRNQRRAVLKTGMVEQIALVLAKHLGQMIALDLADDSLNGKKKFYSLPFSVTFSPESVQVTPGETDPAAKPETPRIQLLS